MKDYYESVSAKFLFQPKYKDDQKSKLLSFLNKKQVIKKVKIISGG